MKSFKILMMAVLTIVSVSVYAQTSTSHSVALIDRLGICQRVGTSLNLTPKEKMKMEVMKIYISPNAVTSDMICNLSNNVATLNLTAKEKMKMEAMKIATFPLNPYVTNGKNYICPKESMDLKAMNMDSICPWVNVSTGDKQFSCLYCSSALNLSPKERMKREAVKM